MRRKRGGGLRCRAGGEMKVTDGGGGREIDREGD